MRLAAAVFAALCVSTAPSPAASPDCNVIRFVVPFGAGGVADVGARLVGDFIGAKLNKVILIENRPGASGQLGTEAVIASPKDGCTILVNTSAMATFPYSFSKLRFDPIKDLIPLSAMGTAPTMIATANKNIQDLKDLLAWSQKAPNGLAFGSSGHGLLAHIATEELAAKTGARYLHVPYRAQATATTDMLSGRLDFTASSAGGILPYAQQGQLKIVAVIQPKRSPLAPDIKTTAEQGAPEMDAGAAYMFFVTSGTASNIVESLSTELNRAVAQPDIRAKLVEFALEPLSVGPKEGTALMKETGERWAPVIKRLNIRLD